MGWWAQLRGEAAKWWNHSDRLKTTHQSASKLDKGNRNHIVIVIGNISVVGDFSNPDDTTLDALEDVVVEAAEQVDAADGAQLPTGWAVATINVYVVQREERVP